MEKKEKFKKVNPARDNLCIKGNWFYCGLVGLVLMQAQHWDQMALQYKH
jgi:hypothetical protein